MATRKALGELYRPVGPKLIQAGIQWTAGGAASIVQAIDLSLPIRGIRLVFTGRWTTAVAPMTSVVPEGFLNLISSIVIQGTNSRQKGNLTLWNTDLATAFGYAHCFSARAGIYLLSIAGGALTQVPTPNTPWPPVGVTGYINTANATYDWRIELDFPFHPHQLQGFGMPSAAVPGFLVRNEEWKDSLQIQMQFGAQAGGGATGSLGVAAGGTTSAFAGFGGVGANPTIDLYSLPVVMGLDLKDQVLPGVCSRVASPTAQLVTAANGVTILNMQKQPTTRVLLKNGTSTVGATQPSFATLNDANVTALGIQLGGNRNVRNVVDTFVHKMQQPDVYYREPIQGYTVLDFIDSGNPDSAYPGQDIGDGATFQLVGNVAGLANAFGIVLQEQILQMPTGPLYTF